MWAKDGLYYRARVDEVTAAGTPDEAYTVTFVEHGNTQPNIPKDKLARAPPRASAGSPAPAPAVDAASEQLKAELVEERKKAEERERLLREREEQLRRLEQEIEAHRRREVEPPKLAASPAETEGLTRAEDGAKGEESSAENTSPATTLTTPSPSTSDPIMTPAPVTPTRPNKQAEALQFVIGMGSPYSPAGSDGVEPSESPPPVEPIAAGNSPAPGETSPRNNARGNKALQESKRMTLKAMMFSLPEEQPPSPSKPPALLTDSSSSDGPAALVRSPTGKLGGSGKGKSMLQGLIASQRLSGGEDGGGGGRFGAPSRAKSSVFTKSVKASTDWMATEPGQLSLVRGAVYAVFGEDPTYYEGTNVHGERGKFPKSKVTVLQVAGASGSTLGRQSRRLMSQGDTPKDSATVRGSLSEKMTKRNNVVQELVSSEATYNEFLRVLLAIRGRLQMTQWSAEVGVLFSNLEPLVLLSDKLCANFKPIMEQWNSNTSCISGPLLACGPFMHAFIDYATSFNAALKRYEALQSGDPKFAEFMFGQRWKDIPFPALAVMPVQRVPRYKLLLNEIAALTPQEHPDAEPLAEVNTLVQNLAVAINENVRSSEMTQALLERSKSREILGEYLNLKRDRVVLMHVEEAAEVKIEEVKKTHVRLLASVFLLSDSLLLVLSSPVKDARDSDTLCGVVREEIPAIFWPTGLIFMRSVDARTVLLVGPLYHVWLRFVKESASFNEMLQSEMRKHSTHDVASSVRSGIYDFGERAGCRVVYEGDWNADGLMHGKGTLRFRHGHYVGEFQDGHMTGHGSLTMSSGDVATGHFVNGVMQGPGTIEYLRVEPVDRVAARRSARYEPGELTLEAGGGTPKEGDKFVGSFVNGVRQGHGEFQSPATGTTYVGAWHNDLMHGEGSLTQPSCSMVGSFVEGVFVRGDYRAPDGTLYSGTFTQWRLLQGAGRIEYANGGTYVGHCRDSLREGTGTFTYPDGSKFDGEWKNNCRMAGTFTGGPTNPVRTYMGPFNEVGMLHGVTGRIVYSDGRTFRGAFFNGEPSKGEMAWPNGLQISGKWKRGRLQGKVMVTYNDLVLEGSVDSASNVLHIRGAPSFRLPALRPFLPSSLYL